MTSFTDWVDEPIAEGMGINFALLRDQRFSVDLARTNIRLSRDEIPHDSVMRLNLDLEPAPHLDYHLFNVLTGFHCRQIGSRSRELLGFIIDARRNYYRSHEQYRKAFCRLQDVWAYGIILEQDRARLINSGTTNAQQLEDNGIEIQKNYVELAKVYAITVEERELRERLTTVFCQMKESFLKNELPLLVFLGKHLYKRHLEINNPQGSLQNENQPSASAQESAPSENNNVVFLVPQENELANIAVMNQDPERVSSSTMPSGTQLMEPRPVSMMQNCPGPMQQNTIRYSSLARLPCVPVQPARQSPIQLKATPPTNQPLSSLQTPIQPVKLATMHQQSTFSPHQTFKFPSYQPSQASKLRMPKFLNSGPPAPIAAAPNLANATPVKEAPPPRLIARSATVKAPAEALNAIRPSRSIRISPFAQIRAHSQTFYQPNHAYQATATAPLYPNAKFAGPLNNLPYPSFPSFPPFPTSSQAPTPEHSAVYTSPYAQTLPAPAASPPAAPAGGFLSRLLGQEMTEQELNEIAARVGAAEQVVEQEACDALCGDEA